jgi:hypothetical protein
VLRSVYLGQDLVPTLSQTSYWREAIEAIEADDVVVVVDYSLWDTTKTAPSISQRDKSIDRLSMMLSAIELLRF